MSLRSNSDTFVLGAVAYDPKVVTIWDGFVQYFDRHNFAFDYILYSNYERQVEGHLAGHIHAAWNSPLAWLEAEQLASHRGHKVQAMAMRNTDRDLSSVVVVRKDSSIRTLKDLKGKTIAVGAADSPQGTLIPLLELAESGLEPHRDFQVQGHDVLLGKHGDHIGGERDAARSLIAGTADAACMIDSNHLLFAKEGTLPHSSTRVIKQTAKYDHCNFTVLDNVPQAPLQRFQELLFSMSYDDPEVRPLLDLEGLRYWAPGRVSGYSALRRAVERFGTIHHWLEEQQVA